MHFIKSVLLYVFILREYRIIKQVVPKSMNEINSCEKQVAKKTAQSIVKGIGIFNITVRQNPNAPFSTVLFYISTKEGLFSLPFLWALNGQIILFWFKLIP